MAASPRTRPLDRRRWVWDQIIVNINDNPNNASIMKAAGTKGLVFDIKEFAVHDGPGIRTTVFLKGCPLRCRWCHNPEGLSFEPEPFRVGGFTRTCGTYYGADDLARILLRDAVLLSEAGGGVTFSGGEPLAQAAFLMQVIRRIRPMHVAVQTSGYVPPAVFRQVIDAVDLVMFDLKAMDDAVHRAYVGVSNEPILANLAVLKASGAPFIARVPLVPGVNDSAANLEATAAALEGAPGLRRVELLPYHPTAGAKYPSVGRTYAPGFDENVEPLLDHRFLEKQGARRVVL
jgi:pyruvate formate lyase activating enzyme